MQDHLTDKLSQAILHTVTYSDIFDYPLTAPEVHQYLTGVKALFEEVAQALKEGPVTRTGDYFTLPGREEIVSFRADREARSQKLLPRALRYGRILGALPYIRMVALTGSLAVMNISESADFDYMLVAAHGRVWTARAFALAFNRLTRLRGHTICPNLIISETSLAWPLHDLYSARELCQMKLIKGKDVYTRLMKANQWAESFLPNAFMESNSLWLENPQEPAPVLQSLAEFPLRGHLGSGFEKWEMDRKIARFQKQAGYGDETVFTAEICQGNFHHHRSWTRDMFESKLAALAAVRGGDMAVTQSPGTAIGASMK
jgi:hypothetical protein